MRGRERVRVRGRERKKERKKERETDRQTEFYKGKNKKLFSELFTIFFLPE